jgi:hypothetical protein
MGVARNYRRRWRDLNVKRVSSMGSLMMKWKLSPSREAAEGLWNGDRAQISSVAAYRREDLQNKNLGYPQGDLHRPHSERLACPSFGRCRNLIQAYPNGHLLIDHRDSRFQAGQVGLWTKADSITAFDELEIRDHKSK